MNRTTNTEATAEQDRRRELEAGVGLRYAAGPTGVSIDNTAASPIANDDTDRNSDRQPDHRRDEALSFRDAERGERVVVAGVELEASRDRLADEQRPEQRGDRGEDGERGRRRLGRTQRLGPAHRLSLVHDPVVRRHECIHGGLEVVHSIGVGETNGSTAEPGRRLAQ